ncbi:MAG: FAD-dependent oxidoreductase [Planctomycetota bacterium]|nr:MAG: FAD-dependent oxidoreductase [Planctomycetota bacterium]
MPVLVRNVRIGLDEPEDGLTARIAKRLRVPTSAVRRYAVVRRSLDARRKDFIHFSYQVEVDLNEPRRRQKLRVERLSDPNVTWVEPPADEEPRPGSHPLPQRPIIVGFGPGGMFAALRLARLGYQPIVLERGREVRERHRDILLRFYRHRDFDPESNLLFGEGGAGTYSDGKLYTRIHNPLCRYILETFYHHGAEPDVLVDARPHIGSDRLPTLCTRPRRTIASLGGEARSRCRVDDVEVREGRLARLHITGEGATAGSEWIDTGPTIFAVGHSARDTIRMLHRRGVPLVAKPFQIGVRIEHPQAMVDRWQYGAAAGHRRLGPAEYHLVAKRAAGPHGDLFSFCMCPGGTILPTSEAPHQIATNGASRAKRSTAFANSGLVITLDPARVLSSEGEQLALDSLSFLEGWERRAFEAGGGTYAVPAQRASDFLEGKRSDGTLETSYPLGGRWTTIADVVPEAVVTALRNALPMLGERFPGFAGDEAVITAPESRASAPVRIPRDPQTRQAEGVAGLYPVGEGAGYAGGIISAAVDGLRSADAVIRLYAPVR